MKIVGGKFQDKRGILRYVNDFSFDEIERFYLLTHPDVNTIRAWQGHKDESKYFFTIEGKFLVNLIQIDNWDEPSKELGVDSTVLSAASNIILHVPPGYVNGIRALEPDSTLLVFSNKTLAQSQEDDFRYPTEYWDMSSWK